VTLSVERVVGRYDRGLSGRLHLVIAGLHGNEPAGVLAGERVLAALEARGYPLRGRLVVLAGNRAALKTGDRFLSRDLNRIWSMPEVERLHAGGQPALDAEGREQAELLAAIEEEFLGWPGDSLLLDMHSTSAGGAPFAIAADTLQNRAAAEFLPIPLIMGLEERIDGPLLSWFADRGHTALVVEGGRHEAESTVQNLEAALWLTLVAGGGIDPGSTPEVRDAHRRLEELGRGLPATVEVIESHALDPDDDFHMSPGYENFQPVEVGEIVACDRRGAIRATRSGLMLMPLYQGQGEDGFFLCRELRGSWLRYSARIRRSGMHDLLPSLPGVHSDPAGAPGSLRVDPDASEMVREVLRLFGYRKGRAVEGGQRFLRRRQGG